ncbi:hypothetical protein GCM10009775_34150 [Microbacterium aoyamense]|uniref:Secreted protein n=1 Tax=Microbacterium aoyamense TaxID=344166 RepID=A0ABP5BAV0_9MICO
MKPRFAGLAVVASALLLAGCAAGTQPVPADNPSSIQPSASDAELPTTCPPDLDVLPEMTVADTQDVDSKETVACTDESSAPTPYVLGLGWDELLPLDGVELPARVEISKDRGPVECSEVPGNMAVVLNGTWYLARQPSCPQLG